MKKMTKKIWHFMRANNTAILFSLTWLSILVVFVPRTGDPLIVPLMLFLMSVVAEFQDVRAEFLSFVKAQCKLNEIQQQLDAITQDQMKTQASINKVIASQLFPKKE